MADDTERRRPIVQYFRNILAEPAEFATTAWTGTSGRVVNNLTRQILG